MKIVDRGIKNYDSKMRKSRLSQHKQSRLIEHFVAGTTARVAGALVEVNKTTAAYYYHRLREVIAHAMYEKDPSSFLMDTDEAYFGGKAKYEGCRGSAMKMPLFGLRQRGESIQVLVLEEFVDESFVSLSAKHQLRMPDATIYYIGTEMPRIFDVKSLHEHRTIYPHDEGDMHYKIAAFESFWAHAKRHLDRFNGVSREHLHVYLKECEWRYNSPDPQNQYKQLKKWVKKYFG